MQEFLEANRETFQLSMLVGALIAAALAEMAIPRRKDSTGLAYRWSNNISLAIVNQLVFRILLIPVAALVLLWQGNSEHEWLGPFSIGFWPSVVVTILVLEFVGYLTHRLEHKVPFLWRIHAVHHSDTEVDFTTTYRNHPLEIILVVPVTVPLILFLELPNEAVILYLAMRQVINTFAHSNIFIPEPVERILKYIIVTPDFHRIHHSPDQKHTDSNYSLALPLFDYLFATATNKPFREQATMDIGLEYFRHKKDSRLDRLLLIPFLWRKETMIPKTEAPTIP